MIFWYVTHWRATKAQTSILLICIRTVLQEPLLLAYAKLGSTVKPTLSGHSKRRPKIGFQDQLSLNAGQKYCRMLQGEHSEIFSTFIKLPFVFKTFVLSIFE